MNQWNGGNNGGGYPQQFPQQQPQHQQYPQQNFAPPSSFGGGGDPFSGINDADPTGSRLPFFEPGYNYVVAVDEIKTKFPSRDGKNLYFVESTIESSNNPNQGPGSRASYMIDLSNKNTSGMNIKRFLAATLGFNADQDLNMPPNAQNPQGWVWSPKSPVTPDGRSWDQVAKESMGPSKPLKGKRLALTTTATKTQRGSDFTVHTWSPAPNAVPQPSNPTQYGMTAPSFQPQQGGPAPSFQPQQGQAPTPSFQPQQPQPQFQPQGAPAQAPQFQPQTPQFQPQTPQFQPAQGAPGPGFNPPAGWNPNQ